MFLLSTSSDMAVNEMETHTFNRDRRTYITQEVILFLYVIIKLSHINMSETVQKDLFFPNK